MKILFADPSDLTLNLAKKLEGHTLLFARNGVEALKIIENEEPEMLFVDLMLPIHHGIEILQKVRELGRPCGVIITSFLTMIQDYKASIEGGADYFLLKPCELSDLQKLIEEFQQGTLKPKPYSPVGALSSSSCYNPIPTTHKSYIKFWGTRGSNPVSGPKYVRYGGNTACIEIRHGEDLVIIDSGTGIRGLGDQLIDEGVKNINLFIGHTHWDHITSFPFFAPIYNSDVTVNIWAPVGYEKNTKALFKDMLAYSFFPVRLDEMHATMNFNELRDHIPMKFGNITIEACQANHPGVTMCFKITSPNKTIGYVTDNEVLLGYLGHPNEVPTALFDPHRDLIDFLQDCEVLIHEAQYLPTEYHKKIGWGHSSVSNATALIKQMKCIEWIVTHHDPMHSDTQLQKKTQLHHDILLDCDLFCHLHLAYDGFLTPL